MKKVLIVPLLAIFVGACGSEVNQNRDFRPSILHGGAGNTGYISNYDVPRRDNLDANGQTARDGIGASIAQITP